MYKTGLVKNLKLFARNLELKYGATDVKILPLINGISCFIPEKLSFSVLDADADQEIEKILDDIIISLQKPYEESETKLRSLGIPSQGWVSGKQVIPQGIERIGANTVWNISTGKAVKVAVLDTGIEVGHPDLQDNLVRGINLINPYIVPNDDNGHGTHIAGIIGAINDRLGVVGVAPKASLYPVKVLDYKGNATLSNLLEGLQWCIDNRVQVINMSLGTSEHNDILLKAIKSVYNAGIVMVAATGNNGSQKYIDYPAAYAETIAVGAITVNDTPAWYSNSNKRVNLMAPGDRVLSTYKNGSYGSLSGTSMAAAHVSGVVALMLQIDSKLSPFQLTNILANSAEKLRYLTEEKHGSGLVRADKTIERVKRKEFS